MKNTMKEASIPNEISIERVRIGYEKHNEISIESSKD